LSATEGQTAAGDLVEDSEEMEALMTEVEEDVMDMSMKHQIVMRRWASLYDRSGAQILKKAMMRHLFRQKYGDAALETADLFYDEYNPLNF